MWQVRASTELPKKRQASMPTDHGHTLNKNSLLMASLLLVLISDGVSAPASEQMVSVSMLI